LVLGWRLLYFNYCVMLEGMNEQPTIIINPDDRDYLRPSRARGLVGLVLRLSGGRIQSESAANHFLFAVAVAIFIASIIIFFLGR